MLRKMVQFVIYLLIVGAICWLLIFIIDYAEIPMPFSKIGKVVVMIGGVFCLIFALLALAGQPIGSFNPFDRGDGT